MDVDEPGQQSKQRELQCQYLEQAPDYFPVEPLSFWSVYRSLFGAFSCCKRLLPSVFVSVCLLHGPLLVPPVLLQENRAPRSRSNPMWRRSRAGFLSADAVQGMLAARERDWKYTAMNMIPNTIAYTPISQATASSPDAG